MDILMTRNICKFSSGYQFLMVTGLWRRVGYRGSAADDSSAKLYNYGEGPYLPWVNTHIAKCLNSVLNVKELVGPFNYEKALA